MNAVVDTNVIAYYLLRTPGFWTEARDFWRSTAELLAPALWEAELANVLWMSARAGVLAEPVALRKLQLSAQLGIHSVAMRTLWQGALVRALQTSVAVYDTLFIELAHRRHVPLATFDAKLIAACPEVAKRPKDLLSAE